MKIIVLHGDHTLESYQRLQAFINSARKRGWEINRIDKNRSLPLSEEILSNSLFSANRLHIVESIKLLNKNELEWLDKSSSDIDTTLVVYYQGSVPNNILKALPAGTKVEEFKLPRLIWKFFDSFYPGNTRDCLRLLHESIKSEPKEFVFALFAKHLRDIYWAKIDSLSLPYPAWRVGKLKSQARKFKDGQLKELISFLAEADIKAKTSKDNLIDSLDFLIATHLE